MTTQNNLFIAVLPPEILSSIFVLTTMPDDHFVSRHLRPVLNGTDVTVTLTQVSRRWREVALSTPELWSRMTVSPPDHAVYKGLQPEQQIKLSQSMTRCLEIWLERSKGVPLYIDLHFNCLSRDLSTDFLIPDVLGTLFRHAHRLRELMITDADLPSDKIPAPPINTTLPLLKRLTLRQSPRYRFPGYIPFPTSLFLSAPKLSHLSLSSAHMLSTTSLPWSQLTHIDINDAESSKGPHFSRRLPAILAECHNLIFLRLDLSGHQFELVDGESRPRPLLPQLQTLIIFGSRNITGLFISDLSSPHAVPRLQTLCVNCEVDRPFSRIFLSFVQRHSATLRSLYIHGPPESGLSPSIFYQICSSLPRLTTLSLNGAIPSVPLITPLTLRPSQFGSSAPRTLEGGLNPFLSSFTMTSPSDHLMNISLVGGTASRGSYAATIESVAFMVQSRWRVPQILVDKGDAARLEEFHLAGGQWDWMARNAPNAFARIKACVDEGLRLSTDGASPSVHRDIDWWPSYSEEDAYSTLYRS